MTDNNPIMTDNNPTEAPPPAGSGEAQQDVAKAIDAKAEATGTATASDELSEDDLEAVAAGLRLYNPTSRISFLTKLSD